MKNINALINKIVLFLLLLVSAYLLYYSFFRSINLSFTHDESYCYHRYMHLAVYKIMLNYSPSANNHILNTLFMKLFGAIFNENEVFLRLHSNLSHIVYLVFTILLVRKLNSPFLKLAGFALLNLNPYMLDFFSLARGYGLVFMFILTSVYFFLQFLKEEDKNQLLLSFILAGFAVYSNFATLYYFSSLLFVATLVILLKERENIKSIKTALNVVFIKHKSIWITALVVSIFIYIPISKLSKANELYGHGSSGYWRSTIFGVLIGSFYEVSYKTITPKTLFDIEKVLSALFFVTAIVHVIRKHLEAIKNPFVIMFLIFFVAAGFEVLHNLLTGTQFIANRAAIYIQILFAVMFIQWLQFLIEHLGKPAYYLVGLISAFLLVVFVVHFNNAKNFKRTNEWRYDADTKSMMTDLINTIEDKDKVYKLGINWLFEPSIKYYLNSRKYSFLEPVTREGIFNKDYDYYFVFKDGFSPDIIENIKAINSYPISNSILANKICQEIIPSSEFELGTETNKVDSLVAAGAKIHTSIGLQDASPKLVIDNFYKLPGNKYYLGIYEGRVLSFEDSKVIGRSEPDKSCEFMLETTNDLTNTFFIHNSAKEYLAAKGDTLIISPDSADSRLMLKFDF